MTKKIIPLLLAVLMMLGSISTGVAATANEITFPLAEPVTMSMFAIINGESELPDNEAFKKAEELTGVKWEVQSCMGADLTEKRNLLLASNQYPDVFYKSGISQTDLDRYGSQGIFVALNDLMVEYAPNYTRELDARPGARSQSENKEGNIYSMLELDRAIPALPACFINVKWLENLGLSEPTNLDELYNVLKAFKEQDANGNGDANDEIPFVTTDVCVPQMLLPYFGIEMDNGSFTYVQEDGTLGYIATSDTFKEFLTYIQKLYAEGLLDKDAFIRQHSQQAALGQQGDVLGMFFDAGAFLTVGRELDSQFRILTPFEEGVLPVNTGATNGAFAITDNCKTPEIAVAWADFFYTEEGARLAWMGLEGETYEVYEDGSWGWLFTHYSNISDVRSKMTLQGAAHHPSIQPELWWKNTSDENETRINDERARVAALGAKPFPTLRISESDNKTIATIKADTDPYIKQYIAQVGTGELDLEASFEEFVATLANMGSEQMMSIYNAAYAEATK